MSPLRLEIIVAVDDRLGIGRDGQLPWRAPTDMAHFRRLTRETPIESASNAVIMGRRTWESIPTRYRPLQGRVNLVLSRSSNLTLPSGVLCENNLDDAMASLETCCTPPINRVFIIGGASVYAAALRDPRCVALYITRIGGDHTCDTFFPAHFDATFTRQSRSDVVVDGDVRLHFEAYARTS